MKIALYGMPCAGKSTLMDRITDAKVINGSQELRRICGGSFLELSEEEKHQVRIKYTEYINGLNDEVIVSDGHYSFMETVAFTEADGELYDIFIYLYCSPENLKERYAFGRNHLVVVTEDGNAVAWGGNENNQAKVPAKATNIAKLASGYYQNCIIKEDGSVVTWGLKGYLLGTDNLGRNVFYRILKGGQMTMTVGFIAVIIQFAIGILVGGISGYYGGTVDILLMRLAEVVGSLPFIPLALILSALIGNKVSDVGRIIMIMLILGFLGWTGIAGLVRAQVLAERNKEFVVAAKALGVKEKNIIFRHIVPNVMTIIIVQATISFATCMLTESGLSFLGFGVAEPIPSWGNMLNNCRSSEVISQYWWRWVFPSVVLGLCTVSINLFGDGLRRAVDPKANER